MDDSINSAMNQALSDAPEESGWTAYFEDFFSNNREYSASSSGFIGSSSLVSDAASCAAWKFSDHNDHVVGYSSMVGPEKTCKKLNFKKRRTRGVLDDDALEDTASSPVNSPKVSDLKQLDMMMNPRKKDDDNIHSSLQENGGTSGHCLELQTDERNELGFIGREDDYTELKKKGLCLVPLSMFVNYLP